MDKLSEPSFLLMLLLPHSVAWKNELSQKAKLLPLYVLGFTVGK